MGISYTSLDREEMPSGSSLGNTEVALKFANYAFEERGLLLGYGVELGLPTGDDEEGIGSDPLLDIESFLNAGYKEGRAGDGSICHHAHAPAAFLLHVPIFAPQTTTSVEDLWPGFLPASQMSLSTSSGGGSCTSHRGGAPRLMYGLTRTWAGRATPPQNHRSSLPDKGLRGMI